MEEFLSKLTAQARADVEQALLVATHEHFELLSVLAAYVAVEKQLVSNALLRVSPYIDPIFVLGYQKELVDYQPLNDLEEYGWIVRAAPRSNMVRISALGRDLFIAMGGFND